MRGVREALEELPHALVHAGARGDAPAEFGQLLRGRQFAVDDQIRRLEEDRFTGEVLDAVAAVTQDPLFAVDEGDIADARPGVGKPVVERDVARLIPQRADVNGMLVLRADKNGKINRLSVG